MPLKQVAGVISPPYSRLAHVVGVGLERLDVERQLGFLPHQVGQRPSRRAPRNHKIGPEPGNLPNQLLGETDKILNLVENNITAEPGTQGLKLNLARSKSWFKRQRPLGIRAALDSDKAHDRHIREDL